MITNKIIKMLFNEKSISFLLDIKNSKIDFYSSLAVKSNNCSYLHCMSLVKKLHNLGLINYEKQGRKKIIILTKIGEEVANNIESIKILLMTKK